MPEGGASRHSFLWIVALAAVFCGLEFLVLGRRSYAYGYGAFLETIPTHLAILKSGANQTFWAPFIGGGFDRLSFWGNADPFNLEPLLLSLLPPWLANGVHAVLQRLMAAVFTALVCRDNLRLPARACGVAGLLALAFSYYTFGAMFTSPGLPLAVWIVNRFSMLRLG